MAFVIHHESDDRMIYVDLMCHARLSSSRLSSPALLKSRGLCLLLSNDHCLADDLVVRLGHIDSRRPAEDGQVPQVRDNMLQIRHEVSFDPDDSIVADVNFTPPSL